VWIYRYDQVVKPSPDRRFPSDPIDGSDRHVPLQAVHEVFEREVKGRPANVNRSQPGPVRGEQYRRAIEVSHVSHAEMPPPVFENSGGDTPDIGCHDDDHPVRRERVSRMTKQLHGRGKMLNHIDDRDDIELPMRDGWVREATPEESHAVDAFSASHEGDARLYSRRIDSESARLPDQRAGARTDVEERSGPRLQAKRLLEQPKHLKPADSLCVFVFRVVQVLVQPVQLSEVVVDGKNKPAIHTLTQGKRQTIARIGDLKISRREGSIIAAGPVNSGRSRPADPTPTAGLHSVLLCLSEKLVYRQQTFLPFPARHRRRWAC
jgi:hypothetical protein